MLLNSLLDMTQFDVGSATNQHIISHLIQHDSARTFYILQQKPYMALPLLKSCNFPYFFSYSSLVPQNGIFLFIFPKKTKG